MPTQKGVRKKRYSSDLAPRDGNRHPEGAQLALLPSLEADAQSRPPKINPRAFDDVPALA